MRFQSYIRQRHSDGQMANMGRDDYISMVENSPIETFIANYRDADGRLVGCVLADVQEGHLKRFIPSLIQHKRLGRFS